MKKEIGLLNDMLTKKQITKDEFHLLSEAMMKKVSQVPSFFYYLINPFQKIAGWNAFMLGLLIMISMSALGVIAKVYFAGFFGCIVAENFLHSTIKPSFLLLLYQNFINCFMLGLLYYIVAKFFKQKNIRIIDFFGTVFLSRFPLLILTIVVTTISLIKANIISYDVAQNGHFRPTTMSTILQATYYLCTVWQTITYFFAYKESSGLSANRLWISFILIIVFGDIAATQLSLIFLM